MLTTPPRPPPAESDDEKKDDDATDADAACSVNEAVNVLPIRWLTTGLPRLVKWLQWLEQHWLPLLQRTALLGKSNKALKQAAQHAETNRLVALHCAAHWTHLLLTRLRALLTSDVDTNPPVPKYVPTLDAIKQVLSVPELAGVVADLDAALTLMHLPHVKEWLLKHSLVPQGVGPDQPLTDYMI